MDIEEFNNATEAKIMYFNYNSNRTVFDFQKHAVHYEGFDKDGSLKIVLGGIVAGKNNRIDYDDVNKLKNLKEKATVDYDKEKWDYVLFIEAQK